MEKINRINALAHKSRTQGLSEAEKQEQLALRAEYLQALRKNVSAMLDNVIIEEEDGTRHRPAKRKER
ncbi:DUF896 domain-containing protein [Christensenellaceae bacterium NSJ-44]|uniref:UPF0291 protein H8699_09355 n=1 Tax=Luoshenia tenuis TaxID=2763654 RepID=A0A926D1H1_9FIRM|nr:DUF896 domain-containing protein [Luoshenia tenuis]MBC8529632.1 DUF896 domain-containing protein [Luoshenia tenuis]